MDVRMITPAIDEDRYCWLVELGDRQIGVHAQSGWCVRVSGRIVILDSEEKFVAVEPLLNTGESEFFSFLQRAAQSSPRLAQQILAFPKEMLLKYVFHTSFSSYWPERALNWLAADLALWPRFREELRTFSTSKMLPQKDRQRAQRMLRAIGSS